MTRPCPAGQCKVTIADDRNVCPACAADLQQHLAELPALVADLDRTMARLRNGNSDGSKGAETPMAYDVLASEALSQIRVVLVGWTRDLEEDPTRQPADTLPAIATWLLARLHRLLAHPAAADICTEIANCTAQGKRAVFGPKPRTYLGPCGEATPAGPCPEDVYAALGREYTSCWECGATHGVTGRREALLATLEDRLYTAAEISDLHSHIGYPGTRVQLRALINTWAHRGLVINHGNYAGQALYRFGEIRQRVVDTGTAQAV